MRAFLSRLCRDAGADDLAQETFVQAWRMARAYRGEGSYRGWLLRIAWRSFLSDRRRRKEDELAEAEAPAASHDPNVGLDIGRALARLGDRERAAALLCFGEGYSHGDAAAILGLPLGTLKSIAARAKAQLATELGSS